MIKAVLFDMGNTLLEFETEPWPVLAERALRSVHDSLERDAASAKLPPFVEFTAMFTEIVRAEEAREEGREVPLALSLKKLLERIGASTHRDRLNALMIRHYEPVVAQVSIYPDALQTLVRLRSNGFQVGLVSNTLWPKEFHLRDLARYEILHLFDSMVFSSELGWAKPHPQIFRRCLEDLAVDASEAVFVGDRFDADVEGAQRVGMRAILKTHPQRTPIDRVRPDAVIDRLGEILPLLETLDRAPAASASKASRRR
ncbi:MAG: HAD-IA family hydrolase [Planctomycetes bacterium]|nr:HAD-IA family hydrolase [Planctomycetota bacterium]MBI3845960.1 HAD-IA family hydrolase [Planctomycetota bacterium]